jgi:DNA polymerase-3 subunit epsilon
MLARDAWFTAIDFESTGTVRGYREEPWQVGLVSVRCGAVDPDSRFDSLLRVGPRPFHPRAPGRHAEVRKALESSPTLTSLWESLLGRLTGPVLVAHGAGTERRFLARAFPMRRFGPWVDTLVLARAAFPDLASHTLGALLRRLSLEGETRRLAPGRGEHDALYDSIGCALLLVRLLELPAWAAVSVEALAGAGNRAYHAVRRSRRPALTAGCRGAGRT